MPTNQRDSAPNVPPEWSKLPQRGSSHTLPSNLGALPKHLGRLIPTKSTTPDTALLLILIRAIGQHYQLDQHPHNHNNKKSSQVSLGSTNKRSKLRLIPTLYSSKSDNGSCLLVLDGSEACFTLHDGIGDAHLGPQAGKEDDELDRVDVVCDDDERGFLGFDEGDNVG